jgi:DNA-binding IclR family transcriptional regulator
VDRNDPEESAGKAAAGAPTTLATERIMGIFEHVSRSVVGRSLTDLSHELDAPKSSLLNLLPGLIGMGYLVRAGRMYRLGPKAFELADVISRVNVDLARVAQPLLRRLAEDTGKTITVAVLDPDERAILHIAKEESPTAMRFAVEVGSRAPVHATAGGHVLLAFHPGDWAETFMAHASLKMMTPNTITDVARLRQTIARTRELGYAITLGDTYETVGAIAAPVFGANGFVCALAAAGAVEHVRMHRGKLSGLVMHTAQAISAMIA